MCIVNYFNVWSKAVAAVGLEDLAFSEVFDASRVENGRKLCQIERNRRLRDEACCENEIQNKYARSRISDDEDDEAMPLNLSS